MSRTKRLRGYRAIVNGWVKGQIDENDIDNFVRAQWITKEEGDRIKGIRRGDIKMAEQMINQYEIAMES